MTRRLDYYDSSRRQDAPGLQKPPSEYIDDSFWFTTQPIEGTDDPEYVQQTISWIGPENLMFSSDFDYSDALYSTLRDGFDRQAIEAIYGGNAKEVLDY